MLVFHRRDGSVLPVADLAAAELSPDVIWIDLLDPRTEEVAVVERLTQLHLPTFADLS